MTYTWIFNKNYYKNEENSHKYEENEDNSH